MVEYEQKTITIVKHPKRNYEVSMHIHRQKGTEANISTSDKEFLTLEEVEKEIKEFFK